MSANAWIEIDHILPIQEEVFDRDIVDFILMKNVEPEYDADDDMEVALPKITASQAIQSWKMSKGYGARSLVPTDTLNRIGSYPWGPKTEINA
jgi:hypothetical protein